jgi:mono/diheme cytochrome c family protein
MVVLCSAGGGPGGMGGSAVGIGMAWAQGAAAPGGTPAGPAGGTPERAPSAPAAGPNAGPDAQAVQRGERVYYAAGGCGCHTDYKHHGMTLAGGRGLKTPFGTYFSTNLTPDPGTGLGRWSEADFVRAMREGVGPDGRQYFPVFPYTSFTRMTDADLHDLWAFLRAQTPVQQADRPPDVWPPFGWRSLIPLWKWLYFKPGRFQPDPARPAAWNRGAYLAQAVAHCGECHTPRNLGGALEPGRQYAGSLDGPDGQLAPNITPDDATGIGRWSKADLVYLLETGIKADGDNVQGLMDESIEHGFSKISAADREAIADYVRSVPAIRHKVRAPSKTK